MAFIIEIEKEKNQFFINKFNEKYQYLERSKADGYWDICKWKKGNDVIIHTRRPLGSARSPKFVFLFFDNFKKHSNRLKKIKEEFENLKEKGMKELFN